MTDSGTNSTAASEADALDAIIDLCPRIQQDLRDFRQGVTPVHMREAEFLAFLGHLSQVADAISALPEDITGLASDIPWRELQRLHAVVIRADFRPRLDVLEATLKDTLPELLAAARELADHLNEYPDL